MDLRKDIYFYANLAAFPVSGSKDRLYVDESTGFIYSWNGISYLVSSESGLNYLGIWDANTNNPTITSSVGDTSDYYIVGTAGTTNINGINDWGVGDWIVFSSTGVWQKIDNSETPSVNIYNSNGTLTGNRTVDLNSNTLTFTNGIVNLNQGTTNSGELRLYEDADFGSDYIALRAPQGLGSSTSFFFPGTNGTIGQVLTTDGAGATSWATVGPSSGLFGIANTSGVYTYYATLTLAMAAATAGQTIELFTDFTESTATAITLKNGVNINGNGHTYNYTAATGNCFIDNGVAVTCSILNLIVNRTSHTSGSVWTITSTSSNIDFLGSKTYLTSASGTSYVASISGLATNLWVKGTGTSLNGIAGGQLTNCYAEVTGGGIALYGYYSTFTYCIGKSVSGKGIYIAEYTGIINCVGISTSLYGIEIEGNDTTYNGAFCSNSVGISTSSIGIRARNGKFINCTGRSTSGLAGQGHTGGGTFYNCSFYSNTNYAFQGNGSVAHNCSFESDGSPVLYNTFLDNSFVHCKWNNSGGHAFIIDNSAYTSINNYLRVTNTSANCLNNSVAISIKYSNNTFQGATTPVNANITQGISNTQDNQGNILL